MIRRHSPIAHAAYADLVASLKDDAVAELRGTPTRVERNGKVYWYDTFRLGSDVRKAYVGEDNDEIRARLARHAELAARRAEAQAARARTIRILRAEGFLGVDGATGALSTRSPRPASSGSAARSSARRPSASTRANSAFATTSIRPRKPTISTSRASSACRSRSTTRRRRRCNPF